MTPISVILPSYNVSKYIRQCLESVLSQTYKWFEVICVDAWSTDGTLEIINEIALKDNRVRLICVDKKSYGKQVNAGLLASRGEYVCVVETDDYLEPLFLERLYGCAKKTEAEVVKSEYFNTYELVNGGEINEKMNYIPLYIREWQGFSSDCEPRIHIWDSYIWNGLYKREFLMNNGICFSETEGAAYQDIGFQQQVYNYVNKIAYVRGEYYHYRIARLGSSSLNPNCLRYIHQEYRGLLEKGIIKPFHIPFVYIRMLKAFPREFGKALMFDDSIKDQNIDNEFKWFIDTIVHNYSVITFSKNLYSDELRNNSEFILYHYEEYKNEQIKEITALKNWFRSFYNVQKVNGVVLLGFGKRGKVICRFLIRNRCNLLAISDNDSEKWGCDLGPYVVDKPDNVCSVYPNAMYLISIKNGFEDVVNQLVKLGIKEKNIITMNKEYDLIYTYLQRHPEVLI